MAHAENGLRPTLNALGTIAELNDEVFERAAVVARRDLDTKAVLGGQGQDNPTSPFEEEPIYTTHDALDASNEPTFDVQLQDVLIHLLDRVIPYVKGERYSDEDFDLSRDTSSRVDKSAQRAAAKRVELAQKQRTDRMATIADILQSELQAKIIKRQTTFRARRKKHGAKEALRRTIDDRTRPVPPEAQTPQISLQEICDMAVELVGEYQKDVEKAARKAAQEYDNLPESVKSKWDVDRFVSKEKSGKGAPPPEIKQ